MKNLQREKKNAYMRKWYKRNKKRLAKKTVNKVKVISKKRNVFTSLQISLFKWRGGVDLYID